MGMKEEEEEGVLTTFYQACTAITAMASLGSEVQEGIGTDRHNRFKQKYCALAVWAVLEMNVVYFR